MGELFEAEVRREGYNYSIDVFSLLLDLKYLAERYYGARLRGADSDGIELEFPNGQRFELLVKCV